MFLLRTAKEFATCVSADIISISMPTLPIRIGVYIMIAAILLLLSHD